MGRVLCGVAGAAVVMLWVCGAQAQGLATGSLPLPRAAPGQGTGGQAHATVTGDVVDPTGQRIAGAVVVIEQRRARRVPIF